jgi:hypothetical protein
MVMAGARWLTLGRDSRDPLAVNPSARTLDQDLALGWGSCWRACEATAPTHEGAGALQLASGAAARTTPFGETMNRSFSLSDELVLIPAVRAKVGTWLSPFP